MSIFDFFKPKKKQRTRELHQSVIMPCVGIRRDVGQLCNTAIRIITDIGPAAFRCPICGAIYIVDPICKTEQQTESMCGSTEIGGHRIEICISEHMKKMQANDQEYQKFLLDKVGKAKAYRAETLSSPGEGEQMFSRIENEQSDNTERAAKQHIKIADVETLDAIINTGYGFANESILSPNMKQVLNTFATGTAAMRQGNFTEAIQIYKQLVASEPRFVAPRVNLANCLFFSGKPQEALRELKHAAGLAPRDTAIYMATARVYDHLHESDQEIQQYQKILEINPRHVQALINLGATYRLQGKYDLAEQQLMRALESPISKFVSGDNLLTLEQEQVVQHNLALIYEAEMGWEKAVRCWKRCVELSPDNDQFRKSLQKAEEKLHIEGQVRLLFDQYANAMIDNIIETGVVAEEYVLEKQQRYKGKDYLDQLEKNSVYLTEATDAFCVAIAQYLKVGTPRLPQKKVMGYVLQIRMTQPQQSTPHHLNFLRHGCAGCPVHQGHYRYAKLRELRQSGNRSRYLDELKLVCKYSQASFTLSQLFLTTFLQDHNIVAIARDISLPNLLDVVIERVNNWTHLAIVGYYMRQSD